MWEFREEKSGTSVPSSAMDNDLPLERRRDNASDIKSDAEPGDAEYDWENEGDLSDLQLLRRGLRLSASACARYQLSIQRLREARNAWQEGDSLHTQAIRAFESAPAAGGVAIIERCALTQERSRLLIEYAAGVQQATSEIQERWEFSTEALRRWRSDRHD